MLDKPGDVCYTKTRKREEPSVRPAEWLGKAEPLLPKKEKRQSCLLDTNCGIIPVVKEKEIKKMKFNPNVTFSAENTLAIRNDGATVEVHGSGTYNQRAYAPTITTLCEVKKCLLRKVESVCVKYQVVYEGEVFCEYSNLKTAETFFIDFAEITRGKYNKLVKAAA